MSNQWKSLGRGIALVIVLNSGAVGWSQDDATKVARELRSSDLPAAGILSPQENDRRIARWLTLDNRMILDCAKLGKEKSERADIRNFAETLVAEHQRCLDDLNAIAGKKEHRDKTDSGQVSKAQAPSEKKNEGRGSSSTSGTNNAASGLGDNSPDRTRTAVLVQDYGASRDSKMIFHPTDFLAIREDVCGHLHNTFAKEWESVSGAEFDRSFLSHQIMAHELLIATIKAVRSTASSNLMPSLDRALEKLNGHLQTARNLSDAAIKTTSNVR